MGEGLDGLKGSKGQGSWAPQSLSLGFVRPQVTDRTNFTPEA